MLLRRTLGALLTATIVGLAFPSSTAVAKSNGCWEFKSKERRFARKINRARSNNGEGRLQLDKQLSKAARRHTWEMTSRSSLYHTPDHKLSNRVTRWVSLGENVGYGHTVKSLHRAFMASLGHRANVLGSAYRHVGIGTRRSDGSLWVTVIFEARRNPGTTLPMPAC